MSGNAGPSITDQPVSSANPFLTPLPRGPMPLAAFLKTAVRITASLARLHSSNIVHRSIRPQNILVHRESGEIELPGSTRAYSSSDPRRAPDPMDSMPYTSPEQAEGMNRLVDFRADLYSLGITLYELLAGVRPFEAEDPAGWVRCHIAGLPRPLTEAMPGTPQVVSDIIKKLLTKPAEERYQSARGLQADLETCVSELESNGRIDPFPLGTHDVFDRLRIPTKLYGREGELASLLTSFERIIATGVPEIALVSGYAGIGKSALVQEMHKPIAREQGFFLSGMFDQYKRDVPYLTIGQAFREAIRQILTGSESKREEWKQRILQALGPNGQLVIDVIPQMEQLIGKQPPVAPLPSTDAENRFKTVLQSFIALFATREHPLSLFLDDLQWADFASLKLLHYVMTHVDMRYFFVLGAYRDNEVGPSHPFITTLDKMRTDGVRVSTLFLRPLSTDHLIELTADTFRSSPARVAPMAELLSEKTGGNPFFVTQFLAELYQESLVRYDQDQAQWEWNITEIQAKKIPDNIVELMVGKLRRLSGETQAALQLAACIGYEFEAPMLEMIHDKTPEETYQDLDEAVRAEFMLRKGTSYKFLHDRVHQAAYSLIPEEHRSWVHLRVGRLLLERTPEADLEDRVFDIVNQFNVGKQFITDPDERRKVAELNLLAGERAKASVAYQSATRYLSYGISFLPETSWTTDYALTYTLHLNLAESEYLNGNSGETERLCTILLVHATSKAAKAEVYRLLVYLHTTKGENAQAVQYCLACMRLVDVEIPFDPTEEEVAAELNKIRALMRNRSIEELIDLPAMQDPDLMAAVSTLAAAYAPAYFTNQRLLDLINYHIVRLSIEHGNSGASSVGYVAMGVTLSQSGEYKDGYLFGKLAYELTEKFGLLAFTFKAVVCNIFACMISIWTRHLNTDIEYSTIGLQAAIQSGKINDGCYHHVQIVLGKLIRGDALEEVNKQCDICRHYAIANHVKLFPEVPNSIQMFVRNMMGLTANFSTFSDGAVDQAAYESHLRSESIAVIEFVYQALKVQARYFSGDYSEALGAAERAKELLWSCPSQVPTIEYYCFSALAAAAHFNEASGEQQREYKERLADHQEKLRIWSESCRDNYLGKYSLLSGEIARLEGKDEVALRFYDQAVVAGRESKFIQIEALANELAARLLLQRGETAKAAAYLGKARDCYTRWGASGKVRQLAEKHPDLLA